VAMPSQYSSSHSLTDAQDLAHKLGILFQVHPIKFPFSVLQKDLVQSVGPLKSVAEENQAVFRLFQVLHQY
jgi:NH3-dependent NAD+ synthetase